MIAVAESSSTLLPTIAASRESSESRRAGDRSDGIRHATSPKPPSSTTTQEAEVGRADPGLGERVDRGEHVPAGEEGAEGHECEGRR